MGDDLFFLTLKKLATDPQYTYINSVTTNDVEKLFSAAYGKSLSPMFDLFLRTTNKLEILAKQKDVNKYDIQLINLDMDLPIEITTSDGKQKILINKKPVSITSSTLPVIDPDVYYLKRVILE